MDTFVKKFFGPLGLILTGAFVTYVIVFSEVRKYFPSFQGQEEKIYLFGFGLPLIAVVLWIIRRNAAEIGRALAFAAVVVTVVIGGIVVVVLYREDTTIRPHELTLWYRVQAPLMLLDVPKPETIGELKAALIQSIDWFPQRDACVQTLVDKAKEMAPVTEGELKKNELDWLAMEPHVTEEEFQNYLIELGTMTANCHSYADSYREEQNRHKFELLPIFVLIAPMLNMLISVVGVLLSLRWKNEGKIVSVIVMGLGALFVFLMFGLHTGAEKNAAVSLWLQGIFVRIGELVLVGLSILVVGVQKLRDENAPKLKLYEKILLAILGVPAGLSLDGALGTLITNHGTLVTQGLGLSPSFLAYQLGLLFGAGVLAFFFGIFYQMNNALKGMQ